MPERCATEEWYADGDSPQSRQIERVGLSSVLEAEEPPRFGPQSTLDAIVSSPTAPTLRKQGQSPYASSPAGLRTPNEPTPLYPSFDEMHPSKHQQSSSKLPDSGLRLGFSDANGPKLFQETPSRVKRGASKPPSSPGFDFKYTRPKSDLRPDARKLLDEISEKASHVTKELMAKRKLEDVDIVEVRPVGHGGERKFAVATGRKGRYSDAHKAEFQKMDSIAGHPSAYRSLAGPALSQGNKPSLKRTKSQAKLDEANASGPPVSLAKPVGKHHPSGPEGPVSPAKRRKEHVTDDISATRPSSRAGEGENRGKLATLGSWRGRPALPSAITTPTKSSLARSASVKISKTITPTLTRASSLRSKIGVKSESSAKYMSSLAGVSRMKSILRRPLGATTEEKEPAADSSLATPQFTCDLNKELPSLPTTPTSGIPRSRPQKRVVFTPSAIAKSNVDFSPSPARIMLKPSSRTPVPATVTYPTLPKLSDAGSTMQLSAGPGHFTFRSPNKMEFGSTSMAPTIRPVRPSIVDASTILPKVVPAVPHGLQSKKRSRIDVDSDEENREPESKKHKSTPYPSLNGRFDMEKAKQTRIPSPSKTSPSKKSTRGGKGILSLSRLNTLAKPKDRGHA
ncbi:MAG: hypothetical protein M1838_000911 [Thelocarpon superellum]|nr:MAG: hypothetical protein M1838_000911 [Thelocarpon superellum]